MTEIRFYHLERQSLDQALPALLTKALQSGQNIIVKTANDQEAERLSQHLWSCDPGSFLPHGSAKDGNAENQPIWITAGDENPNAAKILILTQGATSEALKDYDLCCEMLDGRNPDAVSAARARWKDYKEQGFEMTYWQQGPKGWEKKSE